VIDPIITEGTFDLGRNDVLIRNQLIPREERTEIGKRFITVRRAKDDYENTVLIPQQLRPFLNVMRGIVLGGEAPSKEYIRRLDTEVNNWTATLTPPDGAPITLSGCGAVLNAITFSLQGGEERRISFASPS